MTEIDPDRLANELAADADVIRSLRDNGDMSSIVRPVDVRLIGSAENIRCLADGITGSEWRVVQIVDLDGGEVAADIQRDQTTEATALKALTVDALRLETKFLVRYDGWGTVAKVG
jgi:hypothetical protein